MKRLKQWTFIAALVMPAAFCQNLDSSGNGLLKGTFQFRQLEAANFDSNSGDLTEAVAVYGTITFDGVGNYSVTATSIDNTVSSGSPQKVNVSGTYAIGANGFGYIVNPLDSTDGIYGSVGQGVFIGSSTEGIVDNLFVAIQPATSPSNSTFISSYWAGLIDFTSASSSALKNALFQLTPNGGTFANITLKGQAANQSSSSLTQTITGATYSFPGDGSIALNFPPPNGVSTTNALLNGSRTMFVSADGNFVLGYTANGYDLIFGVKALTSNATPGMYSGLYYTAAIEDGPSFQSSCGDFDAFYGSLVADGNNNQIIHQRLSESLCTTIDFETDDQTSFSTNGNAQDINGYQYAFGDGGQGFVAIGTGGFFSLLAGVHANSFSGSGVFLNPVGITNAASFAPITTSVAPGELITLYGSGLATGTQTMQGGQAFPTSLEGVQVLVNGSPAPIYYVSPTQISAILPYNLASSLIASIQVNNNGTNSNPITLFVTDAIPGVFSQTQNGLGLAAALHAATGQLVTPSNPAVPGEYLSVYLTGLGTVTPPVNDGALGPSSTLSYADVFNENAFAVQFDDFNNQAFVQGNVTFAGLAPGLAGLYQINVQVPKGLGSGNIYLELATDFADVNQIQVPVSSGSSNTPLTPEIHRAGAPLTHGKPAALRPKMRKGQAPSVRSTAKTGD